MEDVQVNPVNTKADNHTMEIKEVITTRADTINHHLNTNRIRDTMVIKLDMEANRMVSKCNRLIILISLLVVVMPCMLRLRAHRQGKMKSLGRVLGNIVMAEGMKLGKKSWMAYGLKYSL